MDRKIVRIWYDAEGDYLEVIFERKVIGFSVTKVSRLRKKPLEIVLS